MTLTKAHIAQKIADDCGFMKNEATELIKKLLDIMKKRFVAGEDVMISGFGKWNVRSKRPRRGRNPRKGVKSRLGSLWTVIASVVRIRSLTT